MKEAWITLHPMERRRAYLYPDGSSLQYDSVTRIYVSDGGTHYLECMSVLHRIPQDDDTMFEDEWENEGKIMRCIVPPGWRTILIDTEAWTHPRDPRSRF